MAESLFTSQTPAVTDASDGTPGISTATTVRFTAAGTVSAIRFRSTTTVGGTYTGELWRVDANDNSPAGTKLASAVLGGTPSGGAWVEIPITPVSVVTNTLYRAVVHNNQGRYVATLNLFDSALTNGNITADAHTSNPVGLGVLNQGTFAISATANVYPANEGSGGTCYFVDVVFDTGGGGSTVAPDGISVPAAVGGPSVSWPGAVAPDGVSVPAAVGAPALAWSGQVAPAGLSVLVDVGSPLVGVAPVAPDGLVVPLAVGAPAVGWSASAAPDGVAVPVAVGLPGAGMPGTVIVRPFTGTVARPDAGVVVRP
ncbi:DUF4082 domain-containing protein [Micromonospora krabiensis]|uniref:DUF4082 domain-containing protein n=1 Tax=Micromonospora krabiensis TaxID=307121 RepID=A0A1C3N4S0_9ACTN|nr:DUF4082 domain-containing protein [Micromonospora krabiensis]SBV27563.1 protein of unknown function [Micromonospora krabiensis]